MFSRVLKFPTLNVNDVPIAITKKTGEFLSQNVFSIHHPFIALFDNEFEFFNESEPINKIKFLRENVDSVLIKNFYRDLTRGNKNIYFFRSWYRFNKDEKLLSYYNVLENLNHPSICSKTVVYMFRASEQIIYTDNDKEFVDVLNKLRL